MREDTLSKKIALVGLDGLEALHQNVGKSAVIHGIAAARLLEELLFKEGHKEMNAALLGAGMGRIGL